MSVKSDSDSSGTIFIYFDKFYYQVKNGDAPERIEVPTGVFDTDERYRYLEHKYFTTKDSAFVRVKEKICGSKNLLTFPMSFEPKNYSVNPTAEYVMQTGRRNIGPYIHKKIYNIITSDTIEITTSDWRINYSPLIYSWSSDGQWLAIAKDDKRDDNKVGSSIVIVNLPKKEVVEYMLDERIEEITWNFQSNEVAVITEEELRARTIVNYINPMAWIQPQTVHSFYLYTIKINGELIRKVEIAHRIDEGHCYGLYWVE
jgi:hypothetical protein